MMLGTAVVFLGFVMLVVDWRLDGRRKRILGAWEDDLATREAAVEAAVADLVERERERHRAAVAEVVRTVRGES